MRLKINLICISFYSLWRNFTDVSVLSVHITEEGYIFLNVIHLEFLKPHFAVHGNQVFVDNAAIKGKCVRREGVFFNIYEFLAERSKRHFARIIHSREFVVDNFLSELILECFYKVVELGCQLVIGKIPF